MNFSNVVKKISIKCDRKGGFKSEREEKRFQEIAANLLQKTQSVRHAEEAMVKPVDEKNDAESDIRGESKEACEVNDKISTLARELAATKNDLERALGEVELLKEAVHDSARRNEKLERKKMLFRWTQLQLAAQLAATKTDLEKALGEVRLLKDLARKNEKLERKKMLLSRTQLELAAELSATREDIEKALSEVMLLKEAVDDSARKNETAAEKKETLVFSRTEPPAKLAKLICQERKARSLEDLQINPLAHGWRAMKTHLQKELQRKKCLRKELQKILDLLESKDDQLQQKSELR